jgi:hypothetical protein
MRAGTSRNTPVTTNTVCSAISAALSAIRSRARATRIMNIAHSRASALSPIATAQLKISRFSRAISVPSPAMLRASVTWRV